jgi:hypothetical protein
VGGHSQRPGATDATLDSVRAYVSETGLSHSDINAPRTIREHLGRHGWGGRPGPRTFILMACGRSRLELRNKPLEDRTGKLCAVTSTRPTLY